MHRIGGVPITYMSGSGDIPITCMYGSGGVPIMCRQNSIMGVKIKNKEIIVQMPCIFTIFENNRMPQEKIVLYSRNAMCQ